MRDALAGILTGAVDGVTVVALGGLALVLALAFINALAGLLAVVVP
jgi:hypothetical protein